MIQSKYINGIVAVAVVTALITALLLVGFSDSEAAKSGMAQQYETSLFGNEIIDIDIIAEQSDWDSMIANATAEEYIMVDVVINGTKFQNVGIRPKGNSSLSQVARDSTTDRFSFRLKFDEYIKGQTCFGLDTFVVNNMLGDNSYMKEYLSYDILKYIGVDTPLYDFANITVNGKTWGFYLAIEAYDDSYLSRVFGDTSGNLYNVKSMDMGDKGGNQPNGGQMPNMPNGGQMPNMPNGGQMPNIPNGGQLPNDRQMPNMPNDRQIPNMPNGGQLPNDRQIPNIPNSGQLPNDRQMPNMTNDRQVQNNNGLGNQTQSGIQGPNDQDTNTKSTNGNNMPDIGNIPDMDKQSQNGNWGDFMGGAGGMGGMGGRGTSGGDLKYTDQNISSYSSIFNNAIGKTTEADQQRVITALEKLSTGTDLETYFDVDQILRYMAAHTVVVNLDSYSSNMAQNYYIYEKNGKITILPWDYNFSFGGFQSGSASAVVNFPIDTPVSGITLEQRPLFDKLISNEKYRAKYHEYLKDIVTGYFSDGKWDEKIAQLDSLIAGYVESDPSAFCTFEEYKKALPALTTLGELRAQSILGQLEGTVPSTTSAQSEKTDALIPAGSLNLSDLGAGMGGGNRGNIGGQNPDKNLNTRGITK